MDDLGVIDQFTSVFSTYIDSGFGLLSADVAFLTTVLITIDIVLAGLFWSMNGEANVLGQFVKKVLYVGTFAFILNNFQFLATVIFDSFAELGLKATGTTITAADLLKPGFVANTGFEAATPLLDEANALAGFPDIFANAVTIFIIMLAWLIVLLAFFILAIQLFVTIIEFKLTTLAGFVLVPFALWNKTAFLAEKVLGNVIASGIKLMVLALIVGIGSTIFSSVTSAFTPGAVTLQQAAATILASLSLLALGIFGPGIATGLVSGAPQLGAGAAVGTALGAGAGAAAGGALGFMGARMAVAGGHSAIRAGASLAGGAGTAYSLGSAGQTGAAAMVAGTKSTLAAGASSAGAGLKAMAGRAMGEPGEAFRNGSTAAFADTGGKVNGRPQSINSSNTTAPNWASSLRREQSMRDASLATTQTVAMGDRPGGGEGPRLGQEERI
ncbi:P-type conjugative transfer protein TrbL [Parvularcula sp. IMCC14364]|uniref:P-type conjugative transfer protein TrbL n=1 Tax=Parvularcula sp. IMCC14364 TaxID=3067902 RepID=UPI002741EAD3|nr:P-type conjugative transfer protein TrbL [Parvularcula sp. IMCC14364]